MGTGTLVPVVHSTVLHSDSEPESLWYLLGWTLALFVLTGRLAWGSPSLRLFSFCKVRLRDRRLSERRRLVTVCDIGPNPDLNSLSQSVNLARSRPFGTQPEGVTVGQYRAGGTDMQRLEKARRWQPAALASTLPVVVARPRHRLGRCFRPRVHAGGWAGRRSTAPGGPCKGPST